MKLQLPNVTLVCVDTISHELAAMAVKDCLDQARFGAVHIHTDDASVFRARLGSETNDETDEEITITKINTFTSLFDVMKYLWYMVPQSIETSHVLFMQWDSGIVDPSMWSEEFLQYDYIGAPWGWHGDRCEVGNGGFSLRSAKLMRFIAKHPDQFPLINPEDDTLCRTYRHRLEENGFYFAPVGAASRFSFERTGYNAGKHFGYHGVFNWPVVFTEQEVETRIGLLTKNEYTKQDKHLGELLSAIKGTEFKVGSAIAMNYHRAARFCSGD